MASTTHAPISLRHRAIRLLESYFALDDERGRRAVVNGAFDGAVPNPAREINFSGPVAAFAADSVDRLLAFGRAGRGKHALGLLIEGMAAGRPGHPNAELHDLPRLLNQLCELPTRAEEVEYLERLCGEIELLARRYSPLAATSSVSAGHKRDDPWFDKDAGKGLEAVEGEVGAFAFAGSHSYQIESHARRWGR